MTYEDIVHFLSRKYKIAERDCERIVDSEFKVLQETIQSRNLKVVNLIKIGKFTPIQRIMKNKELYEETAKRLQQYEERCNSNRSNIRRDNQEDSTNPSN